MRLVYLRCGTDLPTGGETLTLSPIPTRAELKALDAIAAEVLPVDPTPSLAEIAQQPDVAHLGAPQLAPQPLPHPLRAVVLGDDAALSAVLSRLMRADTMWVEVAYCPLDADSAVAKQWGIADLTPQEALDFARTAPVQPAPLVRDDAGIAVAGLASVTDWDNKEITAEAIVDDSVLLRHQSGRRTPTRGVFGARLVPMLEAPGLAAVALDTPLDEPRRGFFGRSRPFGTADASSLRTGRALQAGGENLRVIVDGVSRKRPVDRVTFYRHLRDLQAVRL